MKGEIGWSFVAMKGCEEVVSRHEGFSDRHRTKDWTERTIAPVWSATKGPMAVCVLMALRRDRDEWRVVSRAGVARIGERGI